MSRKCKVHTNMIEKRELQDIIKKALEEDIGEGDITTLAIIPEDAAHTAYFLAKETGVIAGLKVVRMVFAELDPSVSFKKFIKDGDRVEKGDIFAEVSGKSRVLLTGERTALNFLQRMSGIATETARYVEAVKGTYAVILDTRKTAPGLRVLDKWAVRLGGGCNHRRGLDDMILIKDNHIEAVGSVTEAVNRARNSSSNIPVEVEVKSLFEFREALEMKPNRILLDNMSPELMSQAVKMTMGRIPLEASGNVTLENIRKVAQTGVDYISVGALTHSVKALDISLKFEPPPKKGKHYDC